MYGILPSVVKWFRRFQIVVYYIVSWPLHIAWLIQRLKSSNHAGSKCGYFEFLDAILSKNNVMFGSLFK